MSFPIVQLSELCVMDRQGLYPDDPVASRLPYVGVENVESGNGTIKFDNGSRVGSQKSTTFRFDEHHVLYAKLRPYLNKVATPTFAGRCSTELVPLLPRDGIDREFIAYLLRRKETVEYVMASVTGSRMPRTNMTALMSLPVPLPPLNEQRRIVGILNRAAKIERLRTEARDRLQQFIPALFIKMFGDPVTNPMRWPVYTLRELSTLGPQYGANARSTPFLKDQPRYIRITDIQKWGLSNDPVGVNLDNLEPYRLREGDILFARSGATVGKPYIYQNKDGPCVFAGYLIRFRLNENIIYPHVAFAFTQTDAYVRWVADKQRTAAQPNINGKEYATLNIFVPSLKKQREFVTLVSRAYRTMDKAQAAADTAAALSASLMDRLLGR